MKKQIYANKNFSESNSTTIKSKSPKPLNLPLKEMETEPKKILAAQQQVEFS
jgi:hypothetical protein